MVAFFLRRKPLHPPVGQQRKADRCDATWMMIHGSDIEFHGLGWLPGTSLSSIITGAAIPDRMALTSMIFADHGVIPVAAHVGAM